MKPAPRLTALLACLGLAFALGASTATPRFSQAKYAKISARRVETMRLAREGRFAELEALLVAVQQQGDEFATGTAFGAFSTSDESLAAPLDRWVAQSPKSWAAHYARGGYQRIAFNQRRSADPEQAKALLASAIADYQAAIELNPRVIAAYAGLVELSVAARDRALFERTVTKAFEIDPATWSVRDAILRTKTTGNPRAFLAEAAKHERENPALVQLAIDVKLDEAFALWEHDRYPEALAIMDELLKQADVFNVRKNRARLLRVMERYPESAAEIERAIALLPGKYDGYRERGWLHLERKELAESVADFRRGVEIDPLDWELNYGLGQALEKSQDFRGAVAAYRVCVRFGPTSPIYATIGKLEIEQLGDANAALAALDRAVQLDPTNTRAWYDRGRAQKELDDPGAVQSYGRFLALVDTRSTEYAPQVEAAKRSIAGFKRRTPPPAAARP